ncbi:von Willebrand factor A domain-containing protein 8 [Cotesia glomerata]|uniref:von Willebrand factor A domain-containing protein 8 n=1 Tax=Cotesia glomerata TaxID=32391 RepID=UPI001D02A192|nr:von Willebrand factor A domain-containing protein 8 [Cotesia glomerata]
MLLIESNRLNIVNRILKNSKNINFYFLTARKSDSVNVTINDVSKKIKPAKNPEYIPQKYLIKNPSQEVLKNLRWIMQKDILGQDIFLMGGPGPRRRNLALSYLELTEREVEFIALSRDTTETDLKQRREITDGTAIYHDQSAVRAATHGRILILEGVEKAERNVLPVLNNLLENREMHLEDGRFLISSTRYDKLLEDHSQEELDGWKLVRVSEDFRVIALGLPSLRYHGHPLDPPLRSRFQARHIAPPTFKEQLDTLKNLAPHYDTGKLSQLLSCCHAFTTTEAVTLGLPDFPLSNLLSIASILDKCPSLSVFDVFYTFYPYNLFLGKEGRDAVEHILTTFGVIDKNNHLNNTSSDKISEIEKINDSCLVKLNKNNCQVTLNVPSGHENKPHSDSFYIPTSYQNNLLTNMILSHVSSDYCIIGPKGCGKSVLVDKLSHDLGYGIEPIVLYQDMTSRDLIQQRSTKPNGDTIWKNSPLISAALDGKLAVLDGIHRVHPSILAVLHRLICDREIQLHDGKRLIGSERYDEIKLKYEKTDQQLTASGIFRINPSFRIIAMAEPPDVNTFNHWLNSELLSLFHFHEIRPLQKSEEIHIIKTKYGEPSSSMLKIIELAHTLRSSKDSTLQSLAGSLSTRQLLRIAARMSKYPSDNVYETVQKACLARFLPAVSKQALIDCMKQLGINPVKSNVEESIKCIVDDNTLTIGKTTVDRYKTKALTKVPNILFYDVPQHLKLLENLLQDFLLGENILLVGNQGVGKNKIVDRLLQLMNRPREYIQLHRDTTVQTLTLQTIIRDGVVVYEDSPLVQAVKLGHVLLIDEADKAPTHVTCILKTLAENGEMILSDGRRISTSSSNDPNTIVVHPDFRMIVLANRPGFPFLGNDFFGVLGDLFATHSVDNPSFNDEISLLKQYGPDVDDKIIEKLVRTFGELRNMSDQGLVAYPYSTREVVNIVKHLQKFQKEPLSSVVRNVFDFDRYSAEVFDTLVKILHKNGIPIGTDVNNIALAKEFPLPDVKFGGSWNISQEKILIHVQEQFVKLSSPFYPERKIDYLDRVETRSAWFTEMQSYWTIPHGENEYVIGLAVTKSPKNDGIDDRIHVLTMNPLCISTMTLISKQVDQILLSSFVSFDKIYQPRLSITPDNSGKLWIHEESSNTLVVIDVDNGSAKSVKLSSFFKDASNRLSGAFRNQATKWKLKNELISSNNQAILYTPNGNKIDVLDLKTMNLFSMSLPLDIESIAIVSPQKWLIHNTSKNLFILEKSIDTLPCPNILRVVERDSKSINMGTIITASQSGLNKINLSKALNQDIESPNRFFVTDSTYATVVVGLPELYSTNEVYIWPRNQRVRVSSSPIVNDSQIIKVIPSDKIPKEATVDGHNHNIFNYLEVVDVVDHKVRYLPIPMTSRVPPSFEWMYPEGIPVYIAATSNQNLVSVDCTGCVSLWETSSAHIEKSLLEWRKMIGSDGEHLQLTKDRHSGLDTNAPKHGKVDPNNDPHVGGNTWAGGTGGRDTAGLGGKGGPYRLDAGHTVHQLSDEEKNSVPDHVKKAAREMGVRAFKQRLQDIRMSEYDHELYSKFSNAVTKQVKTLRVILGSVQSKSNERQWLKHQTSGELDDTKLIEGLTGEKTIYRRRAEKEPEIGAPLLKPKRFKLVVDVSGSMYRFNGYDGRLDRELEACVMVMEAFSGYDDKFKYDIVGHSGDTHNILFVDHNQPPTNNKERLEIIKMMHAHSQFCMSGDHTLEATQHAIRSISRENADESIVVVFSDANLERYGIPPQRLGQLLTSCPEVNAYVIFIGSLGDQATRVIQKMPSGRAFICMDLQNIPRILQQIFTASMLNTQ